MAPGGKRGNTMSEQQQTKTEQNQDFGGRLAALRRAAGLSQQQLAGQLFVTRQAVSRWEQNRTQPDLATLQQLTEALGCSLDELVGGLDPDASFRRRCAAWQKATRFAFWLALAVQLGLFVLGAARGQLDWVLLPVLLFLCGGSLHPILAMMTSSGDYTMLAGYDPDAAYDEKKLETLVRAMDLWVQLTTAGISLIAVPLAFIPGEWSFGVLLLVQTIGLLGAIGCAQYKYGRNLVTGYPGLAAKAKPGCELAKDIQTQQAKPVLWWSGLFGAQFFLCLFCAGVFRIPNNSPGAIAQMATMLPGVCLGIVFLLCQTSRAKRMAAEGQRWKMNKSGAAMLLGAAALMVLQLLAAVFMQGGGSW